MILSSLFEKRSNKITGGHPKDPALIYLFGAGQNTAAGVNVSPSNASQITAVYAAVKILSESIASLPLMVFERLAEGGKTPARGSLLWGILHDKPNRFQTSFEWREMMVGHLALRGNAYSEIVSTGNNPVSELMPLHPDRVRPFWAPDGTVAYEYRPSTGESRIILQNEMHHLKLRSEDGLKGMSPIEECRESLGLTKAAEEFGARFFGNGTVVGGFLSHPGTLSDKAYQHLKTSWEERHQGVQRSHKPAILEEGMKWQALGIPPEQAQFLETRKFQIAEVARIYRIPPHMLADLERATFSNIEQQGIDFVVHTLRPWLVRIEQAMNVDFFSDKSRRKYFIEFKVAGLLRGDSAARSAYYREMYNIGALSVNEIREMENQNPIPGGDKHMAPLNMTTIDKVGQEPAPGVKNEA